MTPLDLIEILQWIKENQGLYWSVWLSLIIGGYMVFEGIENWIRAWHEKPKPIQGDK